MITQVLLIMLLVGCSNSKQTTNYSVPIKVEVRQQEIEEEVQQQQQEQQEKL